MKRYLVLAGMILLAAGLGLVFFHEKKPRVETGEHRIPPPELTYANMDAPHLATNSHFLDNINLSYEPLANIRDPDAQPTSLAYETNLPPAVSLEKWRPKPDHTMKPGLTVADRKLNFELLGSQGFSLQLNLTPVYPNPEALIPTRLDPGVGVSIKF
jgi:hypothetical protein